MKIKILFQFLFLTISSVCIAQPWVQQNAVFNPSGVPSLPFSQPRFADLDGDNDSDMIIGSTSENPTYLQNVGSVANPQFAPGADIFENINALDAEMGVFKDMDNDGDLDFITGGFTGLNLFLNIGNVNNPAFEKVQGYFTGLNVGQIPVPDLADIDNDGDFDLVVGFSESGLVRIYLNSGDITSGLFSESEAYDVGDIGLYAYPIFCDLDNDGDYDLVAGRDGHNIWYFQNSGDQQNAVWELNTTYFNGIADNTYWNSPGLTDLNNDGTFDLVYGTADGPLHYFVNTGSPDLPAWTENLTLFGGVLDPGGASNPCLFDFDNDGDLDLLSGSQMGNIYYYENTGTPSGPAWNENSVYFASIDHSIYSAVAAGDVNADGLPDVIVGDLSGKLYYHRNTGLGFEFVVDVLQNISLGGWSCPRLIDFDEDGDLDIIAGAENGKLSYIQNQGSPENPDWQLVNGFFGTFDIGSNCVPSISDLDFDGDLDLLCGSMFGDLAFLENQNGNWVQNNLILIGLNGEQNAAPFLADLDADGDDDLVLGEYSGIFSYYRNDFLIASIANTSNTNTYVSVSPNPCHENTTIDFLLKKPSMVKISVISPEGKTLHEYSTGYLVEGSHNYYLDANALSKGLNLVKVETSTYSEVLRLIKF